MSGPVKMKITPEAASQLPEITVLFNPNTYSVTKTVNWQDVTGAAQSSQGQGQTERRKNAPASQFGGGQRRSLSLDLFFDTTEETDDGKKDVRNLTNQIVALTRIVRDQQRPPVCVVSWGTAPQGSDFPFTGVVTQLTQRFTLFLSDGRPVRANLTVAFTEYLDPETDQRQTDPEFTTWLVKRGDTLSSIAAKLYRDPTAWRTIAEANNLDDPRQIPVGLRLNIPKAR